MKLLNNAKTYGAVQHFYTLLMANINDFTNKKIKIYFGPFLQKSDTHTHTQTHTHTHTDTYTHTHTDTHTHTQTHTHTHRHRHTYSYIYICIMFVTASTNISGK